MRDDSLLAVNEAILTRVSDSQLNGGGVWQIFHLRMLGHLCFLTRFETPYSLNWSDAQLGWRLVLLIVFCTHEKDCSIPECLLCFLRAFWYCQIFLRRQKMLEELLLQIDVLADDL